MTESTRDTFSSSFGFAMASAGSAIGLGSIWAFPTKVADNGGGAFVLLYFVISFLVGYPLLLAEFALGRYTRSNPVGAYQKIAGGKPFVPAGFVSLFAIILILSFYSIISGSVLAYLLHPMLLALGADELAAWVIQHGPYDRMLFSSLFFILTIGIVVGGVKDGIEKWSTRLMPALFAVLIVLTIYVLTLDGAAAGLRRYLIPDMSKVFHPQLLLDAMGLTFFSLSLGVGSMLVYGSYISRKENLARMGAIVVLCTLAVSFLAGLLIIPAMYAAAASGVAITDAEGRLISGPGLVFQTLPALFDRLGPAGLAVSAVFFFLMVVAALTSTISMLETPVSYAIDNLRMSRKKASLYIGLFSWFISIIIAFKFELLFGRVFTLSTQYLQPLTGLILCLFVGWVIHRNKLIEELKAHHPEMETSLLMRVWPVFIKVISPLLIIIVSIHSFLST